MSKRDISIELRALHEYASRMENMSDNGLRANLGWIQSKTEEILAKRKERSMHAPETP